MQCCDKSQWRENHIDRSIHMYTFTTVSMGKTLRREMQIFEQREKTLRSKFRIDIGERYYKNIARSESDSKALLGSAISC
jgi:hypothetical protein